MSKDRDDERNTGMPGQETFSLEEILAEFGGGAAKPRWKEDTIPFPVTPRSQRTAPSPAGPPGPGKVVSFPAGRREAPPPRSAASTGAGGAAGGRGQGVGVPR